LLPKLVNNNLRRSVCLADNDLLGWQLLLQLFLILANAIFACAEIAVISVNNNKLSLLANEGDKRAIRLTKLTAEPARFLATIQVGITFAGFLGSAFAADNFSERLVAIFVNLGVKIPEPSLKTISVIIITIILSYFTLILGELVPKRIAMRNAEKLSLAMSGFITIVSKIFNPLVLLLTASTNGLLRLLGIDPTDDEDIITEEEIRLMVDQSSAKGAIDIEERTLIQNVFEFDDITARDIMTHRTEVAILWLDEKREQWEKTIASSRHTVYPVCDETTDNIIGILNIKDYYRIKDKTLDNILNEAIKPAYFIPETVRADVLFRNMKNKRKHFAIVLDEYGGMSGIITMNDLLEELVGELEDDDSLPVEPLPIEQLDSHTWKIKGWAPLKMVSRELDIKLPEEECDTFGGLVFSLLGFIPEDGSTPELEGYGLSIKVIEIKDHQLVKALVCVLQEERNKGNGC
jgi:putative hemolysin